MPFYVGEIPEDKKQDYFRELSNHLSNLPTDEFFKLFEEFIRHHTDNDTVDSAQQLMTDFQNGDDAKKAVLRSAATRIIGSIVMHGSSDQVFLISLGDKQKYGFTAGDEENSPDPNINKRHPSM